MRYPVLALLVFVTACDGDLALVIQLRTDFVAEAEFDRVDVAFDAIGTATRPVSREDNFVVGERVGTFEAPAGSYVGEVRLSFAAEEIIRRPVVVELREASQATVVVARDCRGVRCGDDTPACVDGRCAMATCTAENPEACPDAECETESQCPANAPCARPRCVNGVCFDQDDGSCGADEYCDIAAGACAPRPAIPDAGAPSDAGGVIPTEACGDGPPAIQIVEPMETQRFRPSAEPVQVRWLSSGISGDIRVEVVDQGNTTVFDDTLIPACDGMFQTVAIEDCDCLITLSAGEVRAERTLDIRSD